MKWAEINTEAKAINHCESEVLLQWNRWDRLLDRTAKTGDKIITLHCIDLDNATVDVLDV